MAEEFTEKLIEKSAGVGVLIRYRSPAVQEPLLIDFVHPPPFPFCFTTHC